MSIAKRGGPRPGSGAPKGNLNALKHGRRSRDAVLRVIVGSLEPVQLEKLLPVLKKGGAAFEGIEAELKAAAELAVDETLAAEGIDVVSDDQGSPPSPAPSPLYTHTQTHNQSQSNEGVLPEVLIQRLKDEGFLNADVFVRRHWGAREEILTVLSELGQLVADGTVALRARGAWIRTAVHERVMVRTGRLLQCAHCASKEYVVDTPASGGTVDLGKIAAMAPEGSGDVETDNSEERA